jgi:WD40 repeat protein
MPPLRPPSWIDPLRVPVFGMAWHTLLQASCPPVDDRDHPLLSPRHIIAYSGGGGSARTGVHNHVVVQIFMNNSNLVMDEFSISTGDKVGIAVRLYQEEDNDDNGMSPSLYLLVSLGDEILQYEILLSPENSVGKGGTATATAVVLLCGRLDIPNFDQAGNSLKDMCNAMAVHHPPVLNNTSGQQSRPRRQRLLALGCESGLIRLYTIDNNSTSTSTSTIITTFTPFNLCQGHVQAVCAVHFANNNTINNHIRFVSSAKDGTARVWKIQGTIVRSEATLTCDCTDPNAAQQKEQEAENKRKNKSNNNRPPPNNPIMVRGCAFAGDNDEIIITVASPRRGAAFLSAWQCRDGSGVYALAIRTLISPVPVSAMATTTSSSLSSKNATTTTHVALGTTDGTILLWNVNAWKLSRRYDTVHELPVTCIVIRPHFETIDGDATVVTTVHARSASADGKLANLSLQTTLPVQMRPARLSRPTDTLRRLALFHRFLVTIMIAYIISPILFDLYDSGVGPCRPENLLVQQQRLPVGNNPSVSFQDKWWDVTTCIVEDVLWTPGHQTPY